MKKIILIGVLMAMIFIAGCTSKNYLKLPYFQEVSPIDEIVGEEENKTDVRFFIVNPVINTVAVNVSYLYEEKCFNIIGGNEQYFEVYPQRTWAIVKEFNFTYNKECIQRKTSIHVYLHDTSGKLRDKITYDKWIIEGIKPKVNQSHNNQQNKTYEVGGNSSHD